MGKAKQNNRLSQKSQKNLIQQRIPLQGSQFPRPITVVAGVRRRQQIQKDPNADKQPLNQQKHTLFSNQNWKKIGINLQDLGNKIERQNSPAVLFNPSLIKKNTKRNLFNMPTSQIQLIGKSFSKQQQQYLDKIINPIQLHYCRSKNSKLDSKHLIKSISAYKEFSGFLTKQQLRIMFIQYKQQLLNAPQSNQSHSESIIPSAPQVPSVPSVPIVSPLPLLLENTFGEANWTDSLCELKPATIDVQNVQKKDTDNIPQLTFCKQNHLDSTRLNQSSVFSQTMVFQTQVQTQTDQTLSSTNNNTANQPAESRPIESYYPQLINSLQGLNPNLQILLPQLLLSLQTTQDLANKIVNLIIQPKSNHKQTYTPKISSFSLPVLGDFSISPSFETLKDMTTKELKKMQKVSVWNDYGKIQFLEPISLLGADLQESLVISQDNIQILNTELQDKRLRMTFINFGKYTTLKGEKRQAMLKRMRKWISKNGMHEISHDKYTGDLVVEVDN